MKEPIHVSDANFEKTVLQSPVPVIVDFWAPWCGPCRMVAPVLDKLAGEYENKIIVAKVNTDDHAVRPRRADHRSGGGRAAVSRDQGPHRQVDHASQGIRSFAHRQVKHCSRPFYLERPVLLSGGGGRYSDTV
jgi:thiol-disulfide isomerase/thioredoxin